MPAGQFFSRFDAPWYTGSASSSLVPSLFPVGLNGRPYLVDLKSELFHRTTIDRLREQSDTSDQVGEHSINVDDLWRRSISDWSHGSGQSYYDRKGSDQVRFNTSKGIDPWTKWEASLLRDTGTKRSSANTNLFLQVAGSRLYLTDGNNTLYSTTTTAADDFAAVTGGPAAAALGVASDGFRVYVAYGGSGMYVTNTGSGTFTGGETVTGTVSLVGYAKGRILAANGARLWNVTALGVALTTGTTGVWPDPFYTHPNSSWTWVGFTEGPGFIYAAGYAGDKSLIYRTAVRSDGTALDVPVVAGELPDGEIVRSIQGYLGYMVVGTDKGVRFGTIDGNGNVSFGRLILIGHAVRCFEPQDRFVWFGWENYDGLSTGLGRLDLSVFVDPLTPASASDLMADGQGQVLSAVTFGANYDYRIFTVAGLGVIVETNNKVESGQMTSGQITYGISDLKTAISYNLRTEPLAGSVTVEIATDNGSFSTIGSMVTTGTTQFNLAVGERVGERFEIRETLTRSSVDATTGPTLVRRTLRAFPSPQRGSQFVVPLILYEVVLVQDTEYPLDPRVELSAIQGMIESHRPVLYQEGIDSFSVFVESVDWKPHHLTNDGHFFNGTAVVTLKAVAQES